MVRSSVSLTTNPYLRHISTISPHIGLSHFGISSPVFLPEKAKQSGILTTPLNHTHLNNTSMFIVWLQLGKLIGQQYNIRPAVHYQASSALSGQQCTIRPAVHYQASSTISGQQCTIRPAVHYQASWKPVIVWVGELCWHNLEHTK